MVTHPRVLTQRTPVLRSGDMLPLLCALLSAAFFRSGFLLGAAVLAAGGFSLGFGSGLGFTLGLALGGFGFLFPGLWGS